MAKRTRRIGLSLGADICWPICYEALLRKLDLEIEEAGEVQRFEVERVAIEPFDLRQPVKYDVVIDRLTHWYHTSREWIKKAILTDDLYVFNNPWSLQSMEQHTSYSAMLQLVVAALFAGIAIRSISRRYRPRLSSGTMIRSMPSKALPRSVSGIAERSTCMNGPRRPVAG